MITTNGVLRIKKIRQSRNGAFCVADLSTDFGEFKVKDPMLDQFDEGEYEGKVWISEIYLSQYIAYGKAVVEMRARLHDLQIQTEDRRPMRQEPSEIDPLDEAPATKAPVAKAAANAPACAVAKTSGTRTTAGHTPSDNSADMPRPSRPAPSAESDAATSLFDDEQLQLIQDGQAVKLDPTVDRAQLRAQAAHLGRAGYRFDPKTQTWHHKATVSH